MGDGDGSRLPTTRRPAGGLRKGDERRQAILDAIEQLLGERSIAELSVEDIALAAGISRSGFYFYFESKYAALAEALTAVFEQMYTAGDAFFSGSDERPEVYVPQSVRQAAEVWQRHEPLLIGMVEASVSDPTGRGLWETWVNDFVPHIAARIEDERANGRAPDGPPAAALARTLALMTERVFYDERRRDGTERDTEEMVEALTHMWFMGIWGERPAV